MVQAEIFQQYVTQHFAHFGINKRREITRLLYEISRRENLHPADILPEISGRELRFDDIKNDLIKKRYPNLIRETRNFRLAFPTVDIDPHHQLNLEKREAIAQDVYIEESVADTSLVSRMKIKFPQAHYTTIPSYKGFVGDKQYGISDYNRRFRHFFLVRENYDFFKKCPCSCKSVSCGYHVFNLGQGCAFECTYCYLQDYINSPGIVLPANIEDFFDAFKSYKQAIRVGTGEMTDSLIFDHITEYSVAIVDFFNDYPNSTFEFKTKSDNVGLLLTTKPSAGNIIVGWSVNPPVIIEKVEFYTASLKDRLAAAEKCAAAGFKLAFHFDPVINFPGWEKHYEPLVNEIFDRIKPKDIAWMSVGTLRLSPRLKKIIENRFPETRILDEEMILGYDGKLRYSPKVRLDIYQKMIGWLKARGNGVPYYLCMEEKALCGDCGTLPQKF